MRPEGSLVAEVDEEPQKEQTKSYGYRFRMIDQNGRAGAATLWSFETHQSPSSLCSKVTGGDPKEYEYRAYTGNWPTPASWHDAAEKTNLTVCDYVEFRRKPVQEEPKKAWTHQIIVHCGMYHTTLDFPTEVTFEEIFNRLKSLYGSSLGPSLDPNDWDYQCSWKDNIQGSRGSLASMLRTKVHFYCTKIEFFSRQKQTSEKKTYQFQVRIFPGLASVLVEFDRPMSDRELLNWAIPGANPDDYWYLPGENKWADDNDWHSFSGFVFGTWNHVEFRRKQKKETPVSTRQVVWPNGVRGTVDIVAYPTIRDIWESGKTTQPESYYEYSWETNNQLDYWCDISGEKIKFSDPQAILHLRRKKERYQEEVTTPVAEEKEGGCKYTWTFREVSPESQAVIRTGKLHSNVQYTLGHALSAAGWHVKEMDKKSYELRFSGPLGRLNNTHGWIPLSYDFWTILNLTSSISIEFREKK